MSTSSTRNDNNNKDKDNVVYAAVWTTSCDVCASTRVCRWRSRNNDDDRVAIFGLFAMLDVWVFLSNVDLSLWSLWGVVKPAESKEDDKDKDKGEDKIPKSQTTTTTATHKDCVRKWVNVLDKAERLRNAKNNKNSVFKEGDVKRPIGVDNKEKSGKWTRTTNLSLCAVVGNIPDPRLFALDDPFAVAADPRTEERGDDDWRRRRDVGEMYAVESPLGWVLSMSEQRQTTMKMTTSRSLNPCPV